MDFLSYVDMHLKELPENAALVFWEKRFDKGIIVKRLFPDVKKLYNGK